MLLTCDDRSVEYRSARQQYRGRIMARHHEHSIVHRAWRALLAAAILALVGHAAVAGADEVVSKGTVLHGKITGLSAAGIAFAPEYGAGTLAIKWADIENLKTDAPFQVLYGEDEEANAPLQGFSNGTLQAGPTAIDVKVLHSGIPIGASGPTFNQRMRNYWRYWDGNLDLGFNLQQATTDTTGFLLGFKTVRTKDPTKFTLGANYRYATEKKKGQESSTIQDQLLGLVRGDYSITPRVYGFASGDAMYDAIQRLSIRGVPKAGLGYVIWEHKLDEDRRDFLQAEAGPAWVYEKYFGGTDRNYFAVAFGALCGYYLPYGAHFDWRVDYLPAVDSFTTNYLLRSDASLTLPLIDPVSAKIGLLDEYNGNPAPDAQPNSLFLTAGLSIAW